jgi:hypothetical protein
LIPSQRPPQAYHRIRRRLLRPPHFPVLPKKYRGYNTDKPRVAMASTSFRDSINSLGWSRRDADIPVNTSQQSGLLSSIKSLNPFGDSGYVRLPTVEGSGAPLPAPNRREEEEGWFVRESTPYYPRVFVVPLCHLLSFLRSSVSWPLQTDARCRTCAAFALPCLSHVHMNTD